MTDYTVFTHVAGDIKALSWRLGDKTGTEEQPLKSYIGGSHTLIVMREPMKQPGWDSTERWHVPTEDHMHYATLKQFTTLDEAATHMVSELDQQREVSDRFKFEPRAAP